MSQKLFQIAFSAPQQAELVEGERDGTPLTADEVAGPTLFSLISPGTELAAGFNTAKWRNPGYAACFRVDQLGSEVKGLKKGDIVFCDGQHASWQRRKENATLSIPTGLAPESAVLARLMGVSMTTLTTTSARPPARIMVTGLGPVGNLAAQVFACCGYSVTAVEPDEKRRALAARTGIADVASAAPVSDSPAKQFDLAVDCSGHEGAALSAIKCVRKGGEVVLVGAPWVKKTDLSAHDFTHAIFHRFVTLRSGWEWELPREQSDFRPGSILANWSGALRWLREGRIKTEGLTAIISPKEAQQAYHGLLKQSAPVLTYVFDWRPFAA